MAGEEVTKVSEAGVKVRVELAPAPWIPRLVNVATPPDAVAVTVPISVPPPVAMEAVTTVVLLPTAKTPAALTRYMAGCFLNATPFTPSSGLILKIAFEAVTALELVGVVREALEVEATEAPPAPVATTENV